MGEKKLSDHYYSKQPHSQMKTDTIQVTLRHNDYTFTTGTGVFSKRRIDFGTKLLIESFQPPTIDGPFLDLGCGYGPIGIVLASMFSNRMITMVDINERAIELTKQNITINLIENARAYMSDGLANVAERNYATIITNPTNRVGKKIVYSLLESSYDHLQEGGQLWVVIQKKQGAPSMKTFLATLFKSVATVERQKGYHIICATK